MLIHPKRSNTVAKLALMTGLASTLVVWGGQTYWPLAFSLVGVYLLVTKKQKIFHDRRITTQRSWIHLIAVFLAYACIRCMMYLYHGDRFNVEPLVPFLFFPFLAATIIYTNIQQETFWKGIAIGGILASALAAHQHFQLGIPRSYGFMNPIPFGDLCVAFSLVSIVGASGDGVGSRTSGLRLMLLISAFCSAYGSLLSGTKGGWLSLAMVILFGCYRIYLRIEKSKRMMALMFMLSAMLAIGTFAPNHVGDRIKNGFIAGQEWIRTGEVTDGSVSIRLELWKFGFILFKESPLTGVSLEQWRERRQELVTSGTLSPKILEIQTLDNEFIGNLAEGGIFSFVNTLLLILGPMFVFRQLTKTTGTKSKDLATIGVWIPIIFAEFGLSTSLWGQSAFRQIYVSWLVLLLAMITNTENQKINSNHLHSDS